MNQQTFVIVTAILTSSVVGIFVKSWFDKKKTGAEANSLIISGEISIGEAWKKYAEKSETNYSELIKRFEDLDKRFETMKQEKDAEIKAKNIKIDNLEKRIDDLEAEVDKYKGLASSIKKTIHTKVDEIAEEISQK